MMAADSKTLTSEAVLQWLRNCTATFEEHKDALTQLDAAIGDADHGANMARGFNAVGAKLNELQGKDIGAIFKAVAMTLISTVGGASGPLYGTLFLQAAGGASGKAELTHEEFHRVLSSGVQGLIQRGKAALGEKTMVDALVPALDAFKPAGDGDSLSAALDRAVAAARKGADATVGLVAKKGRGSYLGQRSAGHRDPGASSSVLLLEALQKAVTA